MSENILVCGVNWLGDAVMSMPAIQAYKRRNPHAHLALVVKENLAPLWQMHGAVDEVIPLGPGAAATLSMGRRLKSCRFDQCYVFPNSFRSALIPYMARVPVRVGVGGHGRAWMLTRVLRTQSATGHEHQVWEYLALVGAADTAVYPAPRLLPPDRRVAETRARLGIDAAQTWVALIPGAARGPAKQWPPARFAEVGRETATRHGCRIVVLGTAAEGVLCAQVANAIGEKAVNAAGRTSLPELAAVLGTCALAVTNDSGGMHLAAAVGTRVVAVFGITDPGKTGPLGEGHRIVTAESVSRSRDIAPDSPAARQALRSIPATAVAEAVDGILAGGDA